MSGLGVDLFGQHNNHCQYYEYKKTGVLIYEMLVGYPPFYDDNPFGIYEKILGGKIDWPRHMDPIAKDLVKKLLVPDRTKRMGNMKNGADDVKRHRWFKHLNWTDVLHKKLTVSGDSQKRRTAERDSIVYERNPFPCRSAATRRAQSPFRWGYQQF